jgi:hypothetical protein
MENKSDEEAKKRQNHRIEGKWILVAGVRRGLKNWRTL